MKRGSSVLQPPSDAAKWHTHPAKIHTETHINDDGRSDTTEGRPETKLGPSSSPFPEATSLFSPDVSTKMASDLLIRLSEATQKAELQPGTQEELQQQRCEIIPPGHGGGQQDEPGLALSPDGPGASPEPPSLTHTPDGNTTVDTLASDLLRKLAGEATHADFATIAETQEVNHHGVKVKEEEVSVEVSDLIRVPLISQTAPKLRSHHLLTSQNEEHILPNFKVKPQFFTSSQQSGSSGAEAFQFRVKIENEDVNPISFQANVGHHFRFNDKHSEQLFPRADLFSGVTMEEKFPSNAQRDNQSFFGVKKEDVFTSVFKTEEQFDSGGTMANHCLGAALWQDMSVNLASTLLHQLSERVSKSSSQPTERMTPPVGNSTGLKRAVDPTCPSPRLSTKEPLNGAQHNQSKNKQNGCSYFYRCHVCGFEIEPHDLFQSHMTEHRQWEQDSFSLHCCVCGHSTSKEAAMRTHVETHLLSVTGDSGGIRCSVTPPTAGSGRALSVAMATQLETSTSEHRCRICQRSFPGQQELQVHFQGHRQGNQYRCDRCGHLTRTANKLVEHVRVHTGERPFTCELCPYSAKRRDSLRLHCRVKHPGHISGGAAETPSNVHTHRTYVHGDNQRSNKHIQRLHTDTASLSSSSFLRPFHPSLSDQAGWRDLSPLLPITTLLSLKPRSSCPSLISSSSSAATKHSFLGYLGLKTSL
ncbi:uncharacterized protein ACB058_002385 isoform 1-T1 [Synchiropus picturatus]